MTPPGPHPRPQLVRDSYVDLCGEWEFGYDDADVGMSQRWYAAGGGFDRAITVPYPPESTLSGIADPGYHAVVWYRRGFTPPALGSGQRLLLHFGAVDYAAQVWVGGVAVGQHTGGHTPFTCDVTEALGEPGAAETVVVRVEDQPTDATQPRGKQDWEPEPHDIWYHRTTGIWQPVWAEVVPATHVAELQWTPDLAGARVAAEVRLNRQPPEPLSLEVELRSGGEVLASQMVRVTERSTHTDITVPVLRQQRDRDRVLWSPARPTLVEATVVLGPAQHPPGPEEPAAAVDRMESYLGLRSVGTGDGYLLVNGCHVYLRSVLAQGYWPQSHLAAPDDAALADEAQWVKDLGFNTVRVHQKAADPRFLYHCDRLGLLVWGEMANAYTFDTEAVERLTGEWLEVLRRDRSHPSIVTWVPINESWGVEHIATDPAQEAFATALYHLTRSVDPTRPVISNDGWEHTSSDILSLHDYSPRGNHLRARYGTHEQVQRILTEGRTGDRTAVLPGGRLSGQPVMLTEFGGVRYAADGGAAGWGYSEVDSSEGLLERVRELVGAVLDSPVLSGFCYTQLTDTEQEQNGLLTASREPKVPVDQVREVITGPRGVPGR